jgi:DNA replication and repair protein RecF
MQNSYIINRLILNNYRSYEKLRIDTNSVKNIIITGDNGAGKTNILEAISMFSMSGPFRKAKLAQLGKIESLNPNG